MQRGHILINDNQFYMLVRVEAGVKGTTVNGTPAGVPTSRYNLVNLDTGKTRVSDRNRLMLMPDDMPDISLSNVRDHFNMPNLQDTGLSASELNLGSVVAQAMHEKAMRANINSTNDNDTVTNAVRLVLQQLGIA